MRDAVRCFSTKSTLVAFLCNIHLISGFREKLEKSFHFSESVSKNTDFWESAYCHDLTKKTTQMPPPVSHNSSGRPNKSICSGGKTFFSAECRVSCAFSEVCFGYVMLQSCSCSVQGESSRKWVITDTAISQSA